MYDSSYVAYTMLLPDRKEQQDGRRTRTMGRSCYIAVRYYEGIRNLEPEGWK